MIEKLKPYMNMLVMVAMVVASVYAYNWYNDDSPAPLPVNPAEIMLPAEIEIEVGELGKLDATESKGVSFMWHCLPEGLNIQLYDNDKKMVFSSGKVGKYMCIISSAYGDSVDQKVVTVTVRPQGYDPDAPEPSPTPDNGTLAGKMQNWTNGIQSPLKATELKDLATAFDSVAVQIEAGSVDTAEGVKEATRLATQTALATSYPQWTGFLKNLEGYLKTQRLNGSLVTVEDHVRVWREIAAALRTIRA